MRLDEDSSSLDSLVPVVLQTVVEAVAVEAEGAAAAEGAT